MNKKEKQSEDVQNRKDSGRSKARSENLSVRNERYRKTLKNMIIMDDIFMRNVFKEQKCTEYVLRVIMQQKDLQVTDQTLQADYRNLHGRSATLDCVVEDQKGQLINLEIQQDNEGAAPKRARYHSSLMDANTLDPGDKHEKLPKHWVIFITKGDPLGHKLPIYHVNRKIEEINEVFADETHMIYVNSQCQEDTELGRLMHDLHCKDAKDMYSSVLAERVRQLKETEKGVTEMCQAMEELYKEGVEDGFSEGVEFGKENKTKEIVLSLASMCMSVEDIAKAVKMNIEIVQEWIFQQA